MSRNHRPPQHGTGPHGAPRPQKHRRRRGAPAPHPEAHPPRRRRPPPEGGGEPRRRRKAPKSARGGEFYDVQMRIGLDDHVVRLSEADWQKFLMAWQIGGEDVVFRTRFEGRETNITLRGTSSGHLTVSPSNERKIPRYKLIVLSEMREEIMTRMGQSA